MYGRVKAIRHRLWRRLTYTSRLRRHYKRWTKHGLPTGAALRRAREDC